MKASNNISSTGLWLALGALGLLGAHSVGCSSAFRSCYDTRSCEPPSAGSAGIDAAAGADEVAGANDAADAGGMNSGAGRSNAGTAGEIQAGLGGALEIAGAPEEGGASGALETSGDGGSAAGGASMAGGGGVAPTGGGGSSSLAGSGGGNPTVCNAVAQKGQLIEAQSNPTVVLPHGTHGSIAAGTYILTGNEWFDTTFDGSLGSTIVVTVSGSLVTIQGIISSSFGSSARYTRVLTLSDPVTDIYTCEDPEGAFGLFPASNQAAPADYSATPNTLTLMSPPSLTYGYHFTYTKQ